MNKKLFFIPLAAALMVGCSNDDLDAAKDPGATGETELRYLAVNIVDTSVASRAEEYEAGMTHENVVKSVRFFLFKDSTCEVVDATPETKVTQTPGTDVNVEKNLQAVIVYEEEKGGTIPTQLVAVVNPPASLTSNSFTSPAELQTELVSYCINDDETFIMSNAVYAAGEQSKTEHIGYEITKAFTSREQALANPVDVYVERVAAKVRVKLNMQKVPDKTYYTLYTKKESGGQEEAKISILEEGVLKETQVYLNILGWNVTGTTQKSRLVKKINPAWTFNWGANGSWNNSDNHRSFWAINPSDASSKSALTFIPFTSQNEDVSSGETPETGVKAKEFFTDAASETATQRVYLMENASWDNTENLTGSDPTYPTKLIVAAQLVNDQGVALDLAWWKGSYYHKSALLATLAAESRIYYTASGSEEKKPLEAEKIKLAPAQGLAADADTDVEGSKKHYYLYAQYEGQALPEGSKWFVRTDAGEYTPIEGDDNLQTVLENVNNKLESLGVVKVWEQGYTYYWLDITHLGTTPMEGATGYGYKGIVRNHIYEYSIDSFIGLGVPVFAPTDPIYPETPKDPEYEFIAARLNILSWRLVSHDDTTLGW